VRFPKAWADLVARLRVPSGFLLVAAFLWLARPTWHSLGVGLPVSLLGLILRAWAAGHLYKNTQLTASGPYAFVRNPLYLGTLIVAAGLVIGARRWELALLFAAVFGLIYLPVIQNEESHLRNLFPEYDRYSRRVPALWPKWSRDRDPRRFSFRQYLHNGEYNAALGFLAGVAALIWKAWR
jgi:protein-S-isoprenylcysteine O-methyltransferase Ste14